MIKTKERKGSKERNWNFGLWRCRFLGVCEGVGRKGGKGRENQVQVAVKERKGRLETLPNAYL